MNQPKIAIAILEVFPRLILINFALKCVSPNRIFNWLSHSAGKERSLEETRRLWRVCSSLDRRFFFKPSCLRASLTFFWLVSEGILKIGAKKSENIFEAHAWIECHGQIFSGTLDNSVFEVLYQKEKVI